MTIDVGAVDARTQRARLEALLRDRLRRTFVQHPLTHGQQALWVLHRLAPESPAYNAAIAVRIKSVVLADTLERAFDKLVLRHEVLRTTFATQAGVPIQRVWGLRDAALGRADASGASDEELRSAVAAAYKRPFDLEHGPVVRLDLITRDVEDHVLLLTLHHIAGDAWSLWILLDELLKFYRGELAGVPPTLPQVTPYSAFVKWHADYLASSGGERSSTYWQSRLRAPLPTLELPCDRARPSIVSYEGASLEFAVPDDLAHRLREMARREGVTLYALLMASFQVVLRTLSGQDEIVLGTLAAGRTNSAFGETVGYFVNPVVIRTGIAAHEPFRSVLQAVRAEILEALDHQDYPFALVVDRVQPPRDPTRSPLFQVLFVLQKAQASHSPAAMLRTAGGAADDGLRLEPFSFPQMEGQFDLTLEVIDAEVLSGVWKYSTALFDRATIQRMAALFQEVLGGIVESPGASIGMLSRLPAEQTRTLATWNATGRSFPDVCVHDLIAAQARRTPDVVAVVFDGHSWTYREIDAEAESLARRLRDLGAGPEGLIGISMRRSKELVVAILAVLKAGAAYVPLDPDYPRERLSYMATDANVAILITQHGPERREGTTPAPQSRAEPHNLAYVIYTSGSTGKPKGAMNTHRGLCNRLVWMQDAYRLDGSDAVLQKTPFSFDVSVWEFLWPLMTGARLVVCRSGGHQDPRYLARIMRDERITTVHFVPSMLRAFLDQRTLGEFPALRRVICSGEALPFETAQQALRTLRADVHNLYGPTEASIDVTAWPCRPDVSHSTVPIGGPIANTQIRIVDRSLTPCPIGVAGELCIAGANVGRGYHNRPELTADRFVPDPVGPPGTRVYRTGDVARWLPGGELVYLGRLDTQVKIRGFRIEPGEIEARLAEHPAVREAAVVARADHDGSTRLIAYGVADDEPPSWTALHQFIREALPDYMVPSAFVWLPALPLSPNGKLDRQALPAPPQARPALDSAFADPSTPDEERIAAVWRDVLALDHIGVHDNFFELGGHSILLAQAHARLQQDVAPALTMVDMFQHPTIHLLAKCVAGTRAPEDGSIHEDDLRAVVREQRAAQLVEHRRSRLQHRQKEQPRT